MLYQLSYAPRLRHRLYRRPPAGLMPGIISCVGRFAMPALFSALTFAFALITVASASHGRWVIAIAAAAIGLWMAQFAWAALRRMRR